MNPEMTDEIARGIKSGGIISLAANNKFSPGYVAMMEKSLKKYKVPYSLSIRRQNSTGTQTVFKIRNIP